MNDQWSQPIYCLLLFKQKNPQNLTILFELIMIKQQDSVYGDEVAEWLRRQTANLMGSARVSSNLILVETF
jgi:hypothetical protein